jgi:uncharacterized DUF497 family protein
MKFEYDAEKDRLLKDGRGVSFDEAIEAIAEGNVLFDTLNPNQEKYPGQRIFILSINKYPYCVPYEIRSNVIHLVTIIPSRKYKQYLRGQSDE